MELLILATREGNVNRALSQALGKKVSTEKSASGAPYIKGDDHYISLSHKYDRMVVAVSDKPVGVDIERIVDKPGYYRIADNYFAEHVEHGDVLGFFRGWTRREAFGKMLGVALNAEVMGMNMAQDHIEYQGKDVHFVEKRIDDYIITVSGYYADGEIVQYGGKHNG